MIFRYFVISFGRYQNILENTDERGVKVMQIGEILDILALVIKNADFSVVLDGFKQLIPLVERIISVLMSFIV